MPDVTCLAFRLMPVGPVLAEEWGDETVILAHDVIWDAVREKRPDVRVHRLARMIGNPACASEYGRLAGIAYDMLEEAAKTGLLKAEPINFDRLLARMERSAQQKASGQTSLF